MYRGRRIKTSRAAGAGRLRSTGRFRLRRREHSDGVISAAISPILCRATLVLMLVLLPALVLTGCAGSGPDGSAEGNSPAGDSVAATADTPGTTSSLPTSSTATTTGEAVNADWTLYVDDTISVEVQGAKIVYNLVLLAQKSGGTDSLGTYTGKAVISMAMDAGGLGGGVLNVEGGFNGYLGSDQLTFDVVRYDEEGYSSFESDVPLAPLVEYDAMAFVSAEMSGSGALGVSVSGPQGESGGIDNSGQGSASISMRIAIDGGQVTVDVPALKVEGSFRGTVTGDPVEAAERKKAAEDKLATATTQAEGGGTSPSSGGSPPGLGVTGEHLALPTTFPVDLIPVPADANIISVRDNAPTSVGITYMTAKSLAEVTGLYAPLVKKMGAEPLASDDSVVYMGDLSGKSVNLVIVENQVKGVIVMIDVQL